MPTGTVIPVYSYDTPIADVEVPYIGIDNEKVGYELDRALAEKMGHKGNIAIIAGSREQTSHEKRIDGFEKYMEQEPDIHIEVEKSGYSNLRVSETGDGRDSEQLSGFGRYYDHQCSYSAGAC